MARAFPADGSAAGGAAGSFLRKGVTEKLQKTLSDALGLILLFIGIQGVTRGKNLVAALLSFVFPY